MKILLIVYDNDSYVSWFPQGIAYIASACKNAGHQVEIYNQDVYHWPESHLENHINSGSYDVVGISACGGYYQYQKLLKISKAISNTKNKPFYIIGGHLAAPEPEYFLKITNADAIILGEGEITIIELLEYISDSEKLKQVKGIAFSDSNEVVITDKRPLIEDIDTISWPAYDMFPIDHYAMLRMPNIKGSERCLPVLSGRGCTFECNFCYRMDKGFRPRSAESIVEEIKYLKTEYSIFYIAFSDELLMSSKERTIELCEYFLKSDISVRWECNGRLNYATNDVLELMKRAGCVFINYGIESLDDNALKIMKKGLTEKIIVEGIENTLKSGISPGLNVIFGNISETKQILKKGLDFLLKYNDFSQMRTIRPVCPYPGSPLYDIAIEKGLLKDCDDFYTQKHFNSDLLTVNFTDMTDKEFHEELFNANKILLDKYFDHKKKEAIDAARSIYIEGDTSFRGFRQS
jgi:radical SAM superfamily enzyme YgiQ (UPF0313 family)